VAYRIARRRDCCRWPGVAENVYTFLAPGLGMASETWVPTASAAGFGAGDPTLRSRTDRCRLNWCRCQSSGCMSIRASAFAPRIAAAQATVEDHTVADNVYTSHWSAVRITPVTRVRGTIRIVPGIVTVFATSDAVTVSSPTAAGAATLTNAAPTPTASVPPRARVAATNAPAPPQPTAVSANVALACRAGNRSLMSVT